MKLLNFSCFSKLLINLKYKLQTGMRGAFGKPQGIIIESLRQAKFKFPGRQKVFCS